MIRTRIYLCNLQKYLEGKENGRWLPLPMDSAKLHSSYEEIVGKEQEHVILDYEAPFEISEYEDVFQLNEFVEKLFRTAAPNINNNLLQALFKAGLARKDAIIVVENRFFKIVDVGEVPSSLTTFEHNELLGKILNKKHHSLFVGHIPKEFENYVDFSKVYIELLLKEEWKEVEVEGVTYLVTFYI